MKWPETHAAYFPLRGGENLETAPLSIDPGALLLSRNYEPAVSHGYRRVDGFERFDGRPLASSARYQIVPFQNGAANVGPGASLYGLDSGATGVVEEFVVTGGSAAEGAAQGYVVLLAVTGDFIEGEMLRVALRGFSDGFDEGFL